MRLKHLLLVPLILCGALLEVSTASAQYIVVMSASGGSAAAGGGSGQTVMVAQPRPFLAWLRPRVRRAGILAMSALRFYGNVYNFPVPPAQQQQQQQQGSPTDISKLTGAVAAAQTATNDRLDKIDARLDAIDAYLGICSKTPATSNAQQPSTPVSPPLTNTSPTTAPPPASGAVGPSAAPAGPVVQPSLDDRIEAAVIKGMKTLSPTIDAAVAKALPGAVDAAVKDAMAKAFDDSAIQAKIRTIVAPPAGTTTPGTAGASGTTGAPTNISTPKPTPSATGTGTGS